MTKNEINNIIQILKNENNEKITGIKYNNHTQILEEKLFEENKIYVGQIINGPLFFIYYSIKSNEFKSNILNINVEELRNKNYKPMFDIYEIISS